MNKMSGSMESITMAITDEPMDWMTCLMTLMESMSTEPHLGTQR